MDGPRVCHTECSRLEGVNAICNACMWSLEEWSGRTCLQGRSRDAGVRKGRVDVGREEGRVKRETGQTCALSRAKPPVGSRWVTRGAGLRALRCWAGQDGAGRREALRGLMRVCWAAPGRAWLWPHGPPPSGLLRPLKLSGHNTGVSCHSVLPGIFSTPIQNTCLRVSCMHLAYSCRAEANSTVKQLCSN